MFFLLVPPLWRKLGMRCAVFRYQKMGVISLISLLGLQFDMTQSELNKMTLLLAKGFLSGLFKFIKTLPWWVWIVVTILVLIRIFNKLMSQEKHIFKRRYYNEIELFLINLYYFLFQRKKIIKSGINEIDKMSGKDFEFYLKYLFEKLGYKATHVGKSDLGHRGDMGGDIIVEKDGIKTAVQAKRHKGLVGIDAVREVMGAIKYYQCSKAIVVTNSNFTNEAKIMAQISEIELWNRNKLIEMIVSLSA